MVALSIVLTRFLGFSPQNTPFRFEIGFLPITVVAYLFGPIYSMASYTIADIIGSLFSGYAPNLWITMCQALTGYVMGLFFHKKKETVLRGTLCFVLIGAIIDILIKSPVFIFMYAWTYKFTFVSRTLNMLINLPIRIFGYYFLIKALSKPLFTLMKKYDQSNFKIFANSFQTVTNPGLSRIAALCEGLGHPERGLKFIHIAGTNGKGSTSANIACILEDAGYKVGKYISPNLLKVNERISINGQDISDADLEALLTELEPVSNEAERKLGETPTQFEIWTAIAFLYFARNNCDYVVLEVGLGGEFDATNVIETNEIAIITRLGIDHVQYLGKTLAEVARAKAGIIKSGTATEKVVTVRQDYEALEVIERTAIIKGIGISVVDPTPLGNDGFYERFSVSGYEDLITGIPGYHQIENAALAVEAARILGIAEEHIRSGIRRAKNPARFELIQNDPTVIYDGGHNENGLTALALSLTRYIGNTPKTVVFACMKDKEIRESLRLLNEGGKTEFVFTTVKDNARAASALETQARAQICGYTGVAYEDIGEAYEYALSLGNTVIVCGSLYLYKDFKEYLERNKK